MSPLHHLQHPEWLFEYFHQKVHHAFGIFILAIIGMLRGTSNILSQASAWRQRWGFLNSEFRQQSPNTWNIIYALFGDWSPWSTAYTRLWGSNCIPSTIKVLPQGFNGLAWESNTIYLINPGTYTLTSPIVLNDCSALIGTGDVIIKASNDSTYIDITEKHNVILDTFSFDGNDANTDNIQINYSQDVSLNAIRSYKTSQYGLISSATKNLLIANSYFMNNAYGLALSDGSSYATLNNIFAYNNSEQAIAVTDSDYMTINNAQIANSPVGLALTSHSTPWRIVLNNSLLYNNETSITDAWASWYLYNVSIYNSTQWMDILDGSWGIEYYWPLHIFSTDTPFSPSGKIISWSTTPLDRWKWMFDDSDLWLSYDWMTNVQNSNGQRLLNWTDRAWLRTIFSFDLSRRPIRYVFWWNVFKQAAPLRYKGTILQKYGMDWRDYKHAKYITEPESALLVSQQELVNQYFWDTSIFTKNWQKNWCSLPSFQIKTLNPGIFASSYQFEDHTIYLLTGGDYVSTVAGTNNGFVFNGNCIALIGKPTTRFTKTSAGNSILYADTKRNIIIDTVKIDANLAPYMAQSALRMDNSTNNSTFNTIKTFNASSYGMYFGIGSHHNTIINSQTFNNTVAGIYFYYSSNYNTVTNVQAFNNSWYGIWFTNGSNRNAVNNFQWYNNKVGLYGELTTQSNVINSASLYNNSDAGISLKNSYDYIFNDIKVFNNKVGIRMTNNSVRNTYYWELTLANNQVSDFEGTTGYDFYLTPGSAWTFINWWILNTWWNLLGCQRVTNPKLSGNGLVLLNNTLCSNSWYLPWFLSSYASTVTYIFWSTTDRQEVPVSYSDTTGIVEVPDHYDITKSVGEPFALIPMIYTWPDITPPTAPVLTALLNGEQVFFVTFEWTPSTDIGSWVDGYMYEISPNTTFSPISAIGYITTITWSLWSPSTWFTATTGTYFRRMKAKDMMGNYSSLSNYGSFTVTDFTGRTSTSKKYADLNTYYDSDTIILTGIRPWLSVMASVIGTGTIYRNGYNEGTNTYLQDGDRIYITVKSSDSYQKTLTWGLMIANRMLTFPVTTRWSSGEICITTTGDKATIQTQFNIQLLSYSGNTNNYTTFLSGMTQKLSGSVNLSDSCNLSYLQNLIATALGITLTGAIDTWTYIAANCKEYPVVYDSTKMGYTSSIFKVTTYFANRDTMGMFIDSRNAWNCHFNTYASSSSVFYNTDPTRHIAANGKIYTILDDTQWYTANEMSVKKYFATLEELRSYIDIKNPLPEVRNHTIDSTFTPLDYSAPNAKTYTIYMTDKWYMSYAFRSIRYFDTIQEIETFIDTNNKK